MTEKLSRRRAVQAVVASGALIESVLAVIAVIGVIESGENGWAVVIAAMAVFTALAGAVIVFRAGLSRRRVVVGGYIFLAVVIAGYTALVSYLAVLNPVTLSTWLWVIQAIWLAVVVLVAALAIRLESMDAPSFHSWPPIAAAGGVALSGAMVFGLAAAAIGIAVRELRSGPAHTYTAESLFLEAAFVTILGLTLLLARRTVVALALVSTGPLVILFGVAAISNGDQTLGAWLCIAGGATIGLAIAVWIGHNLTLGISLVVSAFAAAFAAAASLGQPDRVLAAAWIGLAASLAITGVTLLACSPTIDIFKMPNRLRPWGLPRYITVTVLGATAATLLLIWSIDLSGSGRSGAAWAILGCAIGAGTWGIACAVAAIVHIHSAHRTPRGGPS